MTTRQRKAETVEAPAAGGMSVLERAKAKVAVHEELAARLSDENGGHRPLTADEIVMQRKSAMTVKELTAYQGWLYGQWVAIEPIEIDGVLAFDIGHPVPVTHVERGLVDAAQVGPSWAAAHANDDQDQDPAADNG